MSRYIVTVRYGLMAATEKFSADTDEYRQGDEVIVRTTRGIDVGEAMHKPRSREENEECQGELMRLVNEADQSILTHIRDSKEPEEFATCQECIRERQLPMRLVGVEHLFSGDKIIFYFLAENRVDFRELVKELARRYRTRIEMRQIGVRDEARLLADYEHCGRELCCRTFIRNLEPVTMRMAKMQKTTLDPSKISGHCGRLMCCLRFEDEVYSTLQAELPARGSVCVTEACTGEVMSTDMFRQEVVLLLQDGSQETVRIADIKEIQGRRSRTNSGSFPGRPEGNRTSNRSRAGGRADGGGDARRRRGAKLARREKRRRHRTEPRNHLPMDDSMPPDEARERIIHIAATDGRYDPKAFFFVHEAIAAGVKWLKSGEMKPRDIASSRGDGEADFHISGYELLEAFRRLARDRWGCLARPVLESWGVGRTEDVGEIVFLMVDDDKLEWKRREGDTKDQFENGYTFREAFDAWER